jgi:hypothetical protein
MHNRIHPIFANQFLPSLVGLPPSKPTDAGPEDVFTALEIVLGNRQGEIVRMGVVKPSGVTDLDLGALESVSLAAPFGPPPPETLSPDGNPPVRLFALLRASLQAQEPAGRGSRG